MTHTSQDLTADKLLVLAELDPRVGKPMARGLRWAHGRIVELERLVDARTRQLAELEADTARRVGWARGRIDELEAGQADGMMGPGGKQVSFADDVAGQWFTLGKQERISFPLDRPYQGEVKMDLVLNDGRAMRLTATVQVEETDRPEPDEWLRVDPQVWSFDNTPD